MSLRRIAWARALRGLAGTAGALAGLLVGANSVEAQPESIRSMPEKSVVVVLPSHCTTPAFPFASFLDSLRVELAAQGPWCCAMADARPPAGAAVRVELAIEPCDSRPAHVAVRVNDPAGERDLYHDVWLADIAPTARPRALALAVAELIHSAGRDGAAAKPPALAVASASPRPPQSEATFSPWLYSFFGGFELRNYPARESTLWGGRLALAATRRALHAELDLGAGLLRKQVELGKLKMQMASAGLTLGPRLLHGKMIVDLGLRGELGWAWIEGETSQTGVRAGAGSNLVASVGLRLSLEAFAGKALHPRLDLEGGAVLRSLKAEVDGVPEAGISAAYLLASIGVAFAPRW